MRFRNSTIFWAIVSEKVVKDPGRSPVIAASGLFSHLSFLPSQSDAHRPKQHLDDVVRDRLPSGIPVVPANRETAILTSRTFAGIVSSVTHLFHPFH